MKLKIINPFFIYKNRELIPRYIKYKSREIRNVPSKACRNLQVFFANKDLPLTENDRKIFALKNKYIGKRCFLIGNGPSVRIKDLEKLKSEITFCCNRFHLAYNRLVFRPTYTIIADNQVIDDFGQELIDNNNNISTVFIISSISINFNGSFISCKRIEHDPFIFSTNPFYNISSGGSVIIAAMQLAYFMGIREVILYGVDHSFKYKRDNNSNDIWRSAAGDNNHFIKNYRSNRKWCPPDIDYINESFRECKKFFSSHDGFILNATRGGELMIFKRGNLDLIIRD